MVGDSGKGVYYFDLYQTLGVRTVCAGELPGFAAESGDWAPGRVPARRCWGKLLPKVRVWRLPESRWSYQRLCADVVVIESAVEGEGI